MWDRLTQPLLDMGPPSLTPASALGGLSVLLLGVALAGLAGRRAQALADRHPSWPPERVALGLRVTRLAIVLGALLTAANLTGLSLDTLSFVWGLFNAPLLVVAGTEVSVVTILTVNLVAVVVTEQEVGGPIVVVAVDSVTVDAVFTRPAVDRVCQESA